MALTPAHVRDVCLLNQGYKQCIYLEEGDDFNTFYCKKHSSEKKYIEEDRDKVLEQLKKRGIPIIKTTHPLGDNCQGYIMLKVLPQGYDLE